MTDDGRTAALIEAVAVLADDVLWPAAHEVDAAARLPSSHLDAIADLGLHAMVAPPELGGLGLDGVAVRSVMRRLGGGCGATAFAFAQHQGVVAALCATDNAELRDRWLARICDSTLGGTAFAHVRRAGRPAIAAERVDGGWRLTGEAPWATSWGMAEVFTVAAVSDVGELVWLLIEGRDQPGMTAGPPMSLVVFGATSTVRLRFDGLVVDDRDVIGVDDLDRWRAADRLGAVRPNPLCVGIGDRALRELAAIEPDAAAAASVWWADHRLRAEQAVLDLDGDTGTGDGPSMGERITRLGAVRSQTVLAVQRLTTALLAAAGGRGAALGHPAQLLARQSLFYVVQAQNDDGRLATLDALDAAPGLGGRRPTPC